MSLRRGRPDNRDSRRVRRPVRLGRSSSGGERSCRRRRRKATAEGMDAGARGPPGNALRRCRSRSRGAMVAGPGSRRVGQLARPHIRVPPRECVTRLHRFRRIMPAAVFDAGHSRLRSCAVAVLKGGSGRVPGTGKRMQSHDFAVRARPILRCGCSGRHVRLVPSHRFCCLFLAGIFDTVHSALGCCAAASGGEDQ